MKQTFELTITGTENGEWQGRVTGGDGETAEFRSVLELLKVLRSRLGEPAAPAWRPQGTESPEGPAGAR